jgi:tRNA 2-thiouridine synthesizing protein A
MMPVQVIDATGLRCPQPVLKIAVTAADMQRGDILEVWGDCPTFERDVRTWCQRLRKTLLFISENGGYTKIAQIQL